MYLYLRRYSARRVWFTEGLWEVVESEAREFPRLSENIHSNLQIVTTRIASWDGANDEWNFYDILHFKLLFQIKVS